MTVSVDGLVDNYIKLRDLKTDRKRRFDEEVAKINEAMDFIEGQLANIMLKSGVDRMGTKNGVTFFLESTRATVADGEAFFSYLRESDNWQLADIRAAKKNIGEWLNAGNQLPPGVNWSKAKVVRVNRA